VSEPERLFRLADAEALLPRLSEIFGEIRTEIEVARELARELGEQGYQVRPSGEANLDLTAPEDVQRKQRLLLEVSQRVAERLEEVRSLGVDVKAADGLVDFRSRLEDRVVYLCWRFGEERIGFWHELETGFAGRQAIVDREIFEGDYLQ
jgi:hypothetical protein